MLVGLTISFDLVTLDLQKQSVIFFLKIMSIFL